MLAALLGATFLLVTVIAAGRGAEQYVADRCTIPFRALDCEPPPRIERNAFLDEVQYLGSEPDELHLLDDSLAERLAADFALHPRVEKVDCVELLPSRQVRVILTIRAPAPPR